MSMRSLDIQLYTLFQAVSLVLAIVVLLNIFSGTGSVSDISGALSSFVAGVTRKFAAKLPEYFLGLI